MILTKTVEVRVGGQNYKHYKSLGYSPKVRIPFSVPIEHLTHGSNIIVDVRCDYCETVIRKPYRSVLSQRRGMVSKDSCFSCKGIKTKESNLGKYGVENVMGVKEYRHRIKETNLSRYGVEFSACVPEIKDRIAKSWAKRTDEQKRLTRKKIDATNMKRYGVKCPLVLPSSRKKLFETLNRGSSQQKKVYEILLDEFSLSSIFYNKSYSNLSLDIVLVLDKIKIDIEYDSWYWHLPWRDRRRDEFLKSEGYKVLRIKSGRLIPEKESLMIALSKLIDNDDRKYAEIILPDWNEEGYRKKQIRGGAL